MGRIQAARRRVQGSSKTLSDTGTQLEDLVRSLALVKSEPNLQTAGVVRQVTSITEIGEELNDFLEQLRRVQEKSSMRQFMHAVKSGDEEDKQLAIIVSRMDNARSGLILCIEVAQVGLVGNLNDGFRVASQTLVDVSQKVYDCLGRNLVLADMVQDREKNSGEHLISKERCCSQLTERSRRLHIASTRGRRPTESRRPAAP